MQRRAKAEKNAVAGDDISDDVGDGGARCFGLRGVRAVGRAMLGLVAYAGQLALPPRCPSCGVMVDGDRQLCLDCWRMLEFLDGPACDRCSMPFAQPMAASWDGMECGACLADPPDFRGALAAVAYGPVGRRLALRLKYGRRIGDAQLMAQYMARRLPELADGVNAARALPPDMLLIPVPLHRWRIWRRGYNQSALMAQHMARISGAAWDAHALVRHKSTPSLQGKNKRERRAIVAGAFHVDAKARARLRGRHVVLIDDVHASGATLRACAKICKQSGAAKISAITWARVVPAAIMTSNIFDFAAWDSDMGMEEH